MGITKPGLVALLAVVGFLGGCAREVEERAEMSESHLEFLTRENCKNSDKLIVELNAALEGLAVEVTPVKVDLGDLEISDHRTGYGTPTILVDGADLFGMPKPDPATPT